jgi:phosphatidyl-myo-inositol dimannoside synthase
LKIAYISYNYLPFTGGVEIHIQQLAHTLSARHQVTIGAIKFANYAVTKRLRVLEYSLLAAKKIEPIKQGPVQVCSLAPTLLERFKMAPLLARATPRLQRYYYHEINGITRPFYLWAMEDKIRALIDQADVVHCMSFGDLGIAAERAARRVDVPFVCTPFVHPRQWGDGPDDIKLYKRSDAVIALVPTDFAYLRNLGVAKETLHTIGVSPALPNSIDHQAFRRAYGFRDDQPIVLYLGRLMPQKGAKALQQAAPLVWKSFPEAQFVFIGPGTSEEIAIFNSADSRLRYLGRVSDQQKAQALAACTILCLPSISEILPTVYLEAWSLGKPVIAGMARGVPELVEGNNAGLCVSHEPTEIAEAVIRLLRNPEQAKAYGQAGKKLVEKQYSIEAVAGALEQLYSDLASTKRKSYQ